VRAWLREWRKSILQNVPTCAGGGYESTTCAAPPPWRFRRGGEGPQPGESLRVDRTQALGDQHRHRTSPNPCWLHPRADRGVLILNAADFYSSPNSWSMLKTASSTACCRSRSRTRRTPSRAGGLKPDPIHVDVKVVLIGDYALYDQLLRAIRTSEKSSRFAWTSTPKWTSRRSGEEGYPASSRVPAWRTASVADVERPWPSPGVRDAEAGSRGR